VKLTDVIRRPLITEKTSILREDGRTLVFQVAPGANKTEIRRAIETLLGSKVEQARKPDGTPAAPHPSFKPHPMQGWTPDFIPKLTGDAVDMKVIDRLLPVPGPEAIRCSKELATKEGIFVGISSGGTFAGALKVAAEAQKGATILCMLPDTGERYLSTPLFADVPADMTEEELAISRSTPSGQLKT